MKENIYEKYIPVNPFKIPHDVLPHDWCAALVRAFCKAYNLEGRGEYVLSHKINLLFRDFGFSRYECWDIRKKLLVSSKMSLFDLANMIEGQMDEDKESGMDNGEWVSDLPMNTYIACKKLLDELKPAVINGSMENKLYGRKIGLGMGDIIMPANRGFGILLPENMDAKLHTFLVALHKEYRLLAKVKIDNLMVK